MRFRAVILGLLMAVLPAMPAARTLVIVSDRGDIGAELLPRVAPLFVQVFGDFVRAGALDSVNVTFESRLSWVVEPAGDMTFPATPTR